jgi:hypothetical protein
MNPNDVLLLTTGLVSLLAYLFHRLERARQV